MITSTVELDRSLKQGLKRWRLKKLQLIEEEMLELTDDFRAAQEGLGIVHRNSGDVRPDLIEYLWEKLNRSATELAQLEDEHQQLMEMDLAHLIVKYKRQRKDKPRWAFQSY